MRTLLAVIAALALAGCALSPQTINVQPLIAVPPSAVGQGRTVSVAVADDRTSTAIGSRGGVYRESSRIEPANDVGEAIRRQLESGMAQQGWKVVGLDAGTVLRVHIEQLAYIVPEGAVATGADIKVALRVEALRGERRLETTYRSATTRRFPVAPTASQNEAWINETLSETLQRFFDDAKMRAFLTE